MAAPDGIVWGSAVNDYGRIGIYKSLSSTATTTTVTVEVWFWSCYSCLDENNALYYDNLSTTGSATTSVGSVNINTKVDASWSTSNQVRLKSYSYSYTRGTSAVTRYLYAKLGGIDRVGGTMYASTTFAVPALDSYTVAYNANGGSGAPASQTKYYGKTLTLSSATPTRTGHTFKGWATSASGSVAYAAGASYTANSAVTLYAVWQAHTYSVTYNANGGSRAPGTQTKTYGVTLTLSNAKPTRTNYSFMGWATTANATTAIYSAGGSYTANVAVTLYAVWNLDYTKPRVTNFSVKRCDSSGTAKDDGNCALVRFDWACDKAVTQILIEWKLATAAAYTSSINVPASGTSGTVSQVIGGEGLEVTSSYTIKATVADSNGSTEVERTLNSQAFTFHCKPGGDGIAFGKASEKSNAVEFAWDQYDRFGALIGNGLAAYSGGGDSGIDPDTTLEELCLTSHSHGPKGLESFYYIHTNFYNTKSATAARMQVAVPYNKTGSMYHRHYTNGAWSAWARYMTADEIYPVGSVCIRYDTTSPATLYGGTWQRIEGRMLFGCTSSGTVGATGTHTTGSGGSSLPYVNVAIWRRTE